MRIHNIDNYFIPVEDNEMIMPKVIEAHIGESKTFTCDKLGRYWVADLPYWFFNFKNKLPANAIKKGRNLTIASIRRNNYGSYQCFGPKYFHLVHGDYLVVATGKLKVFGKFGKK